MPVLDGLQELVDQSLLRQVRSPGPSPARYAMLETIREFAAGRLDAMAEAEQARRAHAAAFLALTKAGGRPQAGLATKEWLERIDIEHNNIRAALAWDRQHHPAAALRLAASMLPRSGPCAGTIPRAGSAWASCSPWCPRRASPGSAP